MKRLLVMIALALAVPCLALGQATPQKTAPSATQAQPAAPKPGPEHQKLAIWLGEWTYEGEYKPTPLGAGGKYTGTMTIRPILDGFFLEVRAEEKGAAGTSQYREIDGYDPSNKKFMWYGFGSDGSHQTVSFTIDGTALAYAGTLVAGGKRYQVRGTIIFAPGFMSNVLRQEVSVDGQTWIPHFESKNTKTSSSPR